MPARESSSAETHTPGSWLDAVRSEERRGELLSAFDLAQQGLAEHPDDLWLKHRAVLALARAGATDEAARRFDEYGLAGIPDEDVAALKARIAKDLALRAGGEERRRLAARAAHLYGAVFAETGGYYPAVNAATLWLVAGESARSRELAAAVLELLTGADSYYEAATEAEARLLLGEQARGCSGVGAGRGASRRRLRGRGRHSASAANDLRLPRPRLLILERARRPERGPFLRSPDRRARGTLSARRQRRM